MRRFLTIFGRRIRLHVHVCRTFLITAMRMDWVGLRGRSVVAPHTLRELGEAAPAGPAMVPRRSRERPGNVA
jgi:hypothetical protein